MTCEEKAQISEFISLMFFRVPLKEESLKKSILGINDIIMDMATCTKDGFIEEMRKSNIRKLIFLLTTIQCVYLIQLIKDI